MTDENLLIEERFRMLENKINSVQHQCVLCSNSLENKINSVQNRYALCSNELEKQIKINTANLRVLNEKFNTQLAINNKHQTEINELIQITKLYDITRFSVEHSTKTLKDSNDLIDKYRAKIDKLKKVNAVLTEENKLLRDSNAIFVEMDCPRCLAKGCVLCTNGKVLTTKAGFEFFRSKNQE